MGDLTVLYLTLNRMPEKWVKFHMDTLIKATVDCEVISISKEPVDLGHNILDTDEPSYSNIYRQMLRGAELSTTKYVAMAEDDVLYSKEHFKFRPADDCVAYNRSRWSLFTWSNVYSLRQRVSNCSLIAPRELLIKALTERFKAFENQEIPERLMGEVGRNNLERQMGITERKSVDFFSEVPIVHLSHPDGTEERQKIMRKSHGQIKAYDIPFWGKASEVLKNYES